MRSGTLSRTQRLVASKRDGKPESRNSESPASRGVRQGRQSLVILDPLQVLSRVAILTIGPGSGTCPFTCVDEGRSVRRFAFMIRANAECKSLMGPFYFTNGQKKDTASNVKEPQIVGGGKFGLARRHRNWIPLSAWEGTPDQLSPRKKRTEKDMYLGFIVPSGGWHRYAQTALEEVLRSGSRRVGQWSERMPTSGSVDREDVWLGVPMDQSPLGSPKPIIQRVLHKLFECPDNEAPRRIDTILVNT